jgi:hypothetical protein
MEKSVNSTLGLDDFIGKGRTLNLSGFGSLEKAKETDIEKGELGAALGYNFTNNNKFSKKGSDIAEKIKALVAKVTAKQTQALSDMMKIVEDTGVSPTQPLDRWDKENLSDEVASTMKSYSWEQCCFDSNNQTACADVSVTTEKKAPKMAASQDHADKHRLYNSILNQFLDCCRDLTKADVFLRNVDEKKTYTLSLDEMKSLGF